MNEPGKIRGNAFTCKTVEHALLALQHELIKEDSRLSRLEMKRGNCNIYRMGHYLKALTSCTEPNPKTLQTLRHLIATAFCEGFGPRERVLKAIDEILTSV